MPRMVARLLPAIAIVSLLYFLYLLFRYIFKSEYDRTKMVFVAILTVASTIILFMMTATEG